MAAPARLPHLVLLATSAALATGACSSEPNPPRGYHSPNVAWADDAVGLVWLNRRVPTEAVMFARARKDDATLIGEAVEISQTAWNSDPPLIASNGRSHLVVWTQAGGRDPGLMLRAMGPEGPQGPESKVVEASLHLCPQLLWVGDAYVVSWREESQLFLGRIDAYGALDQAPVRIAHETSVTDCRVGWNGRELAVLWAAPDEGDYALNLVRVSPYGDIIQDVTVETWEPVRAAPLDLAWHDGAWIVAYAGTEKPGALTTRIEPDEPQTPGPALPREQWVRTLSLAPLPSLGAAWSETTSPKSRGGRLLFDLLGGRTDEPLEIGSKFKPRLGINTSVDGRTVALTWSGMAGSSTNVAWGIIRLRGEGEGEGATASWQSLTLQ